jgi:hypothetical protein
MNLQGEFATMTTPVPYLRLGGCHTGPDGTEGCLSVLAATFFTVYLTDRHGQAHVLTDHDTLMDGLRAMIAIAHRAGLEATMCAFLSSTSTEA